MSPVSLKKYSFHIWSALGAQLCRHATFSFLSVHSHRRWQQAVGSECYGRFLCVFVPANMPSSLEVGRSRKSVVFMGTSTPAFVEMKFGWVFGQVSRQRYFLELDKYSWSFATLEWTMLIASGFVWFVGSFLRSARDRELMFGAVCEKGDGYRHLSTSQV